MAISSPVSEMPIPARTPSPSSDATIGLTFAGLMFGVWIAVHIWAMFFFTVSLANWPLMVAIVAVQCWLSVGMFIVAHDAMHGSLAPGWHRTNAAIGTLTLFLYAGFGWRRMRDAHFAHHRHVGSADDPDFNAEDSRSFWPWYTLFLKRYFGLQSVAFISTVVITYFFILNVPLQNITLLYAVPAIASSFQLFYFGTYLPHRHDDSGFSDKHNARTNDFGVIASLFSCFHFGYHHEHHLAPGTPWWALPQAHREYRRSLKRDVTK